VSLGPTDPALRANPSPEVTDRICRLPLPTLFYRLEAVHLGDLMRIWVRPGARFNCLHGLFKGRRKRTGHRESRGALQAPWSLSPAEPIPGSGAFTKKRELSPGPPATSSASFALPHGPRASAGRSPRPGSGILTRFPFDRRVEAGCTENRRETPTRRPNDRPTRPTKVSQLGSGVGVRGFLLSRLSLVWQCLGFRTEFSYLLGPTHPCSTAVHMEPFSTSVFKVLV